MNKKSLIVLIIILGLVVRVYQFREGFNYAHDNDLASWIVKDIVIDHHPRLIGQLTSSPGIFIGSLFYYVLIPFYFLAAMDPIGSLAFSWLVGLVAIISLYYVFRQLFEFKTANIGSLIYAASFSIVSSDRQVVPTTPVMLWSIWFFYAINKLFAKDKHSLILLAVLFALVWHLNLALGLLFPLVIVGILKNKFAFKDFIFPAIIFSILSLPLISFELRHNFSQTRALFGTLESVGEQGSKLLHTVIYLARNANDIYLFARPPLPWFYVLPFTLLATLIISTRQRSGLVIYPIWLLLYILFFTLHPINLSEYYLAGLNILFIAGGAIVLSKLPSPITILVLMIFLGRNLYSAATVIYPRNGYIEKKAIVTEIKKDAQQHGYPCVAVSYITDTGYDLGYRYFFYLAKLHVNSPQKGGPVYSIVFPQSRVDHLDRSFGAIGLIYPDYSRYNDADVANSCSGPDPNLTGDMFGFTK